MNSLPLDKCTILKYSCLQTTMTCTPRLGVTQGHWKWLHSMDCVWLSINVQLVTMAPHYSTQLCRYLILKNTATGVLKLESLDYHVVKTASSQVCFHWTYTQHHNITTIPITALSRPDVQWTFKESYTAIWHDNICVYHIPKRICSIWILSKNMITNPFIDTHSTASIDWHWWKHKTKQIQWCCNLITTVSDLLMQTKGKNYFKWSTFHMRTHIYHQSVGIDFGGQVIQF